MLLFLGNTTLVQQLVEGTFAGSFFCGFSFEFLYPSCLALSHGKCKLIQYT
jgi:hypothetical protein